VVVVGVGVGDGEVDGGVVVIVGEDEAVLGGCRNAVAGLGGLFGAIHVIDRASR